LSSQDGYQLAVELESAWQESVKSGAPMDIVSSLKRYEKERRLRVAIIHGLARMAAIMATVYIPHSGVGLEPLALLTKSSRLLIKYGMDMMLSWVLTGNSSKLEGRPLRCLLSDKANDKLYQWLEDDDAMEEAMGGEWYLFPTSRGKSSCLQPVRLFRDEQWSLSVGSQSDPSESGSSLSLSLPQISERHATITCKNKAFYVTDLGSEHGTWITDNAGRLDRMPPNFPVRFRPSDLIQFGYDKKAMFRVKVLNTPHMNTQEEGSSSRSRSKSFRQHEWRQHPVNTTLHQGKPDVILHPSICQTGKILAHNGLKSQFYKKS